MKQLTGFFVVLTLVIVVFGYAIPVHAQFFSDGETLFDRIPAFELGNDNFIKRFAPDTDFGFFIRTVTNNVSEALTFNDERRAELKLQHAQVDQDEINDLDSRGLPIPLQLEQRRIAKINEATEILNNRIERNQTITDKDNLTDRFDTLREMGELNDIRILYSQLPRVIESDHATKQQYNEKVNSLDTWQNNCHGEFDVDNMVPLSMAVKKLETQCPRLVELQNQFGYERIKMMVSGTV